MLFLPMQFTILTGSFKDAGVHDVSIFKFVSVVLRRCRVCLGFEVKRPKERAPLFAPCSDFQVSTNNNNTMTIGKVMQNNEIK